MTNFKRLGRNNKNRGRAFERRVAEELGFHRVDDVLSAGRAGLVEHDLGSLDGGDIVDVGGRWLLECKTQPAGNISIKDGWLEKLFRRAAETDRYCGVVTTRYKEQGAWVILPADDEVGTAILFSVNNHLWPDTCWATKVRGKGIGFVIQDSWLQEMGFRWVARLDVHGDKVRSYLVMRLETFKAYLHEG